MIVFESEVRVEESSPSASFPCRARLVFHCSPRIALRSRLKRRSVSRATGPHASALRFSGASVVYELGSIENF